MTDEFGEELRKRRASEGAATASRQSREDMIRATRDRVIDGAVAEITRFFTEDSRVKQSFGRVNPAIFNGDHSRFRVVVPGRDITIVVEGTAQHDTSVNPLGHMTNQVVPSEFVADITLMQDPGGPRVAVESQFRGDGGATLHLYTALMEAVS